MAGNYLLGGHQLDSFIDLGIVLNTKLNCNDHVTLIVSKARSTLGFIKRWAKEFFDSFITKQLYISLVRLILDYGYIVWDLQYNVNSEHMQFVEKQFLLFYLRGLGWNYLYMPSYTSRLPLTKLSILKSHWTMLNKSFMINLINSDICCELLLRSVNFRFFMRNFAEVIMLLLIL